MQEKDWIIEPIPTQQREIRVASRSRRILAAYLNRICWNEMRGVEALSIATRYFSRIPQASLNFARHNADEARHAAMFASRAVDLGGAIIPVPGRADVLSLLPGFKREEQGDMDTLVNFLSRGYVEEYRGMLFFEAMSEALDCDALTSRLFRRIAQDERMHVTYMRELLEPLAQDGYSETIPALIRKYQQAATVSI
ncbi:MAG: ferritin-like domain-containing protein [Acidobacteriota bacterium]